MKFIDVKSRMNRKFLIAKRILSLSKTIEDKNKKLKYRKMSANILNCHQLVDVAVCKHCGHEYFQSATTCKNKFCPICARKRSNKYLSLLLPIFENFVNQGYYINMLNLTIKNTTSLEEGVTKIYSAWREMTHNNHLSAEIFKNMFIGGVRNFEITMNIKDNTCHPHFHLLVIKKRYSKDFDNLRCLWDEATKKVFNTTEKVGSVYITSVKDKNNKSTSYFKDKTSIMNGCLEVIKYITKFDDDTENKETRSIFEFYPDDKLIELIDVTNKMRALSTFGVMYGYQKELDKISPDEDEHTLAHRICKWCERSDFEFYHELIYKISQLEDF